MWCTLKQKKQRLELFFKMEKSFGQIVDEPQTDVPQIRSAPDETLEAVANLTTILDQSTSPNHSKVFIHFSVYWRCGRVCHAILTILRKMSAFFFYYRQIEKEINRMKIWNEVLVKFWMVSNERSKYKWLIHQIHTISRIKRFLVLPFFSLFHLKSTVLPNTVIYCQIICI